MSTGLNQFARGFAMYQGKLYIVGWFTVPYYYVATWDGTSFSPVNYGLADYAHTVAVYNDLLVVGGDFSGYLTTWDGQAWDLFPGAVNNAVWSLTAATVQTPWPTWKYVAVIVPAAVFVLVATVVAVVYVLAKERKLKKLAQDTAPGKTLLGGPLEGPTEPLLAHSAAVTIQSE